MIPADDRLLVEIDDPKEKEYLTPENSDRESYRTGKVLDVGELAGTHFKDMKDKRILFERYGPLHLKQFNEKWFLVRPQYILAVLD